MVLFSSVCLFGICYWDSIFFFFQAEDGIRDLVRSRGLGDVYKRQGHGVSPSLVDENYHEERQRGAHQTRKSLCVSICIDALSLSLIHI